MKQLNKPCYLLIMNQLPPTYTNHQNQRYNTLKSFTAVNSVLRIPKLVQSTKLLFLNFSVLHPP